jgi:hypothetical protein
MLVEIIRDSGRRMKPLPMKKVLILFSFLFLILLAPFSMFKAEAQTGIGHWGKILTPHSGLSGTEVTVSFNIGTGESNLYNGKNFSLIWDIGGWNGDNVVPWSTVSDQTQWRIILGTANWTGGHLSGKAIVPVDAEVGEHVLYAVYDQGLGTTLDFWWDFFEVTGTGTAPPATLAPTTAPTPTPRPSQCTLTVKWETNKGHVIIDGADSAAISPGGFSSPRSITYPYGTTSKVTAVPNQNNYGIRIVVTDYSGSKSEPGNSTILYMDSDKSVEITFGDKPCFIATATFGSELTPEVQFLRSFRQNAMMQSFTGSQFVAWFNMVYYSFSPSVAQAVNSTEASKDWMKSSLYPMMGILYLGVDAYSLFSFSPDMGAIVFVVMVSSLMTVAYLFPLTLIILTPLLVFKGSSISTKRVKQTGLVWIGCIMMTLIAIVAKSPVLMMGCGAALVGLTVLLTTMVTVKYVSELWIHRRAPKPL